MVVKYLLTSTHVIKYVMFIQTLITGSESKKPILTVIIYLLVTLPFV